jgi:glycosyltransferase involved in cell wall biosynthesis
VKLALVVQRYGPDIAGGSEAHCRALAHRLAPRHEITVLTTCASDYVTWANVYPPGESRDGPIRVLRFPVRRTRHMRDFADLSDEVFSGGASVERQRAWFQENGPDAPALLDHLRQHGHTYDLVLFWTFRYAPSFFGVPLVADRAVLVPTAEEDEAIDLPILRDFFGAPAAYLFLTPEEATLVSTRAGRVLEPSAVVGIGLEPAAASPDSSLLRELGLERPFLLYLGRVDENKGCRTLLDYFVQYADGVPSGMPLVLAGPAKMTIPSHPRIRALGYVSNEVRSALLTRARLLVVPSLYESLSIVLLEAWNHAVPALVNGGCKVLVGQVRRANGGLFYRSQEEFAEALRYLDAHPDVSAAFGRQGLAYVEREYRWQTVVDRLEALLAEVAARRSPRS